VHAARHRWRTAFLPLPRQSTTTPETRAEKGREIQGQIIGADRVENLYASAPNDQMHIQRYLSANCFGDHVARGGIDIPTRELLTLSMRFRSMAVDRLLLPFH
jgi:4-carboxymuconolactone decarboxylase